MREVALQRQRVAAWLQLEAVARARRVQPGGLSYARYELLTLLSFTRTGELPLSKIGDRLQVHPASVTGAVDKLEQQGLVVRVPHPEDRRAVLARITERGREVAELSTAALNQGPFSGVGLTDEET